MPLTRATFELISESFLIPLSYLDVMKRRSTAFIQIPQGYHESYPDAQSITTFLLQ